MLERTLRVNNLSVAYLLQVFIYLLHRVTNNAFKLLRYIIIVIKYQRKYFKRIHKADGADRIGYKLLRSRSATICSDHADGDRYGTRRAACTYRSHLEVQLALQRSLEVESH